MVLKIIVGIIFFLMTLMLGFFIGKDVGREEAKKEK